MAFSGRVRVLSLSESLATIMTSISSSSLYHWTLALLEVVLIILTSNFLPCASNFNLFSVKIKFALYLENQFDPIKSSSLVESTIWMLIGIKTSIILSWAFFTIPKVGLFWLFTVTIFVASVGLIHFRPNFTTSSLVQPYKKLGYVFYTFCIRFVYVFKKSTVFIRNWSIFRINYTFLIIRFLYVFKNLIKNVELKTYNLYEILTNSL